MQSGLSPDECFHIALTAYQNQKFQCAMLWIQETMAKLHEGAEAAVTEEKVLTLLNSVQIQVRNPPFALGITQLSLHNGNFQ